MQQWVLLFIEVKLLPLLFVFVEFLSIQAFTQLPIPGIWGCARVSLSDMLVLEIKMPHNVSFGVALGAILLGLILVVAVGLYVTHGGRRKLPLLLLNLFGNYVNLVSTLLYTTILQLMWSQVPCLIWQSSPRGDEMGRLSGGCVSLGLGGVLAIIVPVSIYFVFFSFVLNMNSYEFEKNASHILRRSHGMYDLLYTVVKTIIVVVSLFKVNSVSAAILHLVLLLFMFFTMLMLAPHYVPWVNKLRQGLHLALVVNAICALAFVLIGSCDNSLSTKAPVIVYWALLVPVVFIGSRLSVSEKSRKWARATLRRALRWITISSVDEIVTLRLEHLLRSATRVGQLAKITEGSDPAMAGEFYSRAIKADAYHTSNLGNYAMYLLHHTRNPDVEKISKILKHSLELDPHHTENLGNYALFNEVVVKDTVRADIYYRRAVDADQDVLSDVQHMYSSLNEGLVMLDRDYDLATLDCNAATLRMFRGTTRRAFTKIPLFERSPATQKNGETSLALAERYVQQAFERQEAITRFEWQFLRTDNTVLNCEVALTPKELGLRKLLQASITDLSSLGHVQDHDSTLQILLATVAEGIISISEKGVVTEANPAATRIIGGFHHAELVNLQFMDLFHQSAFKPEGNDVSGVSEDSVSDLGETRSQVSAFNNSPAATTGAPYESVNKRRMSLLSNQSGRALLPKSALDTSTGKLSTFNASAILAPSSARKIADARGMRPEDSTVTMTMLRAEGSIFKTEGSMKFGLTASQNMNATTGSAKDKDKTVLLTRPNKDLAPEAAWKLFGQPMFGDTIETYLKHKSGRPVKVELSVSKVALRAAQMKHKFVAVVRDLSENQTDRLQLGVYQHMARVFSALVRFPFFIADVNDDVIVESNPLAAALFGRGEMLDGLSARDLIDADSLRQAIKATQLGSLTEACGHVLGKEDVPVIMAAFSLGALGSKSLGLYVLATGAEETALRNLMTQSSDSDRLDESADHERLLARHPSLVVSTAVKKSADDLVPHREPPIPGRPEEPQSPTFHALSVPPSDSPRKKATLERDASRDVSPHEVRAVVNASAPSSPRTSPSRKGVVEVRARLSPRGLGSSTPNIGQVGANDSGPRVLMDPLALPQPGTWQRPHSLGNAGRNAHSLEHLNQVELDALVKSG